MINVIKIVSRNSTMALAAWLAIGLTLCGGCTSADGGGIGPFMGDLLRQSLAALLL